MSSTLKPATLADRAEALTDQNNGPNPARPPAVAAASPLHEIVVQELAAGLPAELRARVEAEPSVERVMDWIGAGSVFRWVRDDPIASRVFLGSVATDPREAGLKLARALAAKMEPPPRDAAWHAADRHGLVRQLLFASGVLATRAVVFAGLGWLAGLSPFDSPATLALSWFGLGVVFVQPLSSWGGLAVAGLAGLWLLGEAFLAPRIMEHIRQEPARQQQLPPPVSWRRDAFQAAWMGQALGLTAVVGLRFLDAMFTGEPIRLLARGVGGLLVLVIAVAVLRRLPRC